jgi:phosphoenolpyruvate carboxykinase (ATP)
VAHLGPLVVRTGNQTSLTHQDRFIVSEAGTQGNISWGEVNRPFDSDRFAALLKLMGAYFNGQDVFVQNGHIRTGSDELMPIRVITETAWHSLFARNNYLLREGDVPDDFRPVFTVLHAPGFRAIPQRDGTNSDVFVIVDLARNLILIGGTSFAGEIQKALFSVANYLLPRHEVLTLECAANVGDKGDVALFAGVDGSGKTTLATDSTRVLLGDSEHGWNSSGIFSIGRGCSAAVHGLSVDESPDIWQTTRRFGTILENVVVDPVTRHLDLNDGSFTENTRASYPISHVLNATRLGVADHPDNIILLAKDAFGVLPPVSKLSPEQAQLYFLSGYSTEIRTNRYGEVTVEPVFSSCFGAPFMPLHKGHYARMFGAKIKTHKAQVWLLNTGWMGGAYGVGERIPLEISRNIVRAIVSSRLAQTEFKLDGYFGLLIPLACPGVSPDILEPAHMWADVDAYAQAAHDLIDLFDRNIEQFRDDVNPAVLAAQPKFA